MKRACLFLLAFLAYGCLRASPTAADTLMSLYGSALQHSPSIESFRDRERALAHEKMALGWRSLRDVDVASNYSRLSTKNLGRYSNGELGVFNTFDVLNRKGADRAIAGFEIQKNRSLTDVEKKNIFSMIADAYFALVKHTELLNIHEDALGWMDKNIMLVGAGVDKGVFPASDVSRWTIEQLTLRNSIRSDRLEIERADETLRILTGLESIAPEDSIFSEPVDISENALIAHSPETAVLELEKKQLEMEIRRELGTRLPDLQVGNSLVMNNEPESTGDQYMVSANLNFKLFDGGRRQRILAIRDRIRGLENERKALVAELTGIYRNRIGELNAQREMLANLVSAVCFPPTI